MLTLIAAATLSCFGTHAELTAADFMNLKPGARHFYEEKSMRSSTSEDEVGRPIEITGKMATPVITRQNGRTINTTYYRVDTDGVYIVGYDPATPLPSPLPIFKFAGKQKVTWAFDGPTGAGKEAEMMQMAGEAQQKGERTVLGKKVAVLEVHIKAVVGRGITAEQVDQVALYGEGVGLFQLTSTTRINKAKAVSEVRLVKTEEPKAGD